MERVRPAGRGPWQRPKGPSWRMRGNTDPEAKGDEGDEDGDDEDDEDGDGDEDGVQDDHSCSTRAPAAADSTMANMASYPPADYICY